MKEDFNKEKVGLTDIARQLNVSVSTVSRALNNHPRISKKTKEKVRQVATRLGYFPGIPELMTPDRTDAVAVVVPSVDSCVNRKIIAGFEKVMGENGYQTFLIDLKGDEAREATFFKTFRNYGISGMVHLISNRLLPEGFYKGIQKDAIPLVMIFDSENDLNTARVIPDMFKGISRIVSHLKANGANKITLVLEDDKNPVDNHLVTTFEMVLENLDLSAGSLQVVYKEADDKQWVEQVEMLLEKSASTHTIVVKGMVEALELYTIAQKRGASIPGDIMLIGVGSDCSHGLLTSGISMLKIPAFEMGEEAAKLLLSRLNSDKSEKQTIVTPADFILKQSAMRIRGRD